LPVLTLSADAGDALGRLIAERVALNAREVGLQIQVVSAIPPGATADLRLARIVLVSPDPGVALRDVGKIVGANVQVGGSSPQDVYVAEKKLIEDGGLIPLFHLPLATLAGERVRNFPVERLEAWPIEEVWLEAGP